MKVSKKKPAHRPTFLNKGGGVTFPEIIRFLLGINSVFIVSISIKFNLYSQR